MYFCVFNPKQLGQVSQCKYRAQKMQSYEIYTHKITSHEKIKYINITSRKYYFLETKHFIKI